jgi:hypothetical protein
MLHRRVPTPKHATAARKIIVLVIEVSVKRKCAGDLWRDYSVPRSGIFFTDW